MLHLLSEPEAPESLPPYAEAVARLASIRHALRLVDPYGGGPAADADDAELGEQWLSAPYAKRRCFDARTGRVIAATAEGLDALLSERKAGREPNPAASAALAEEIRRGLRDVGRLLAGGDTAAAAADPYPLAL